jgi:hypothetical protein
MPQQDMIAWKLHMPVELRAAIERAARQNDRSLAAETRTLIKAGLRQRSPEDEAKPTRAR